MMAGVYLHVVLVQMCHRCHAGKWYSVFAKKALHWRCGFNEGYMHNQVDLGAYQRTSSSWTNDSPHPYMPSIYGRCLIYTVDNITSMLFSIYSTSNIQVVSISRTASSRSNVESTLLFYRKSSFHAFQSEILRCLEIAWVEEAGKK